MNGVGNNSTSFGDANRMLSAANAIFAHNLAFVLAIAALTAGAISMTYLIVERRKFDRVYGEAGSNIWILLTVGGALLIQASFLMINIASNAISCGIHVIMSSSLLPITAAAYLARTWIFMVQFARVSEQTRWFHIYQQPVKERDELKTRPQTFRVRLNSFITKYKALSSLPLLLVTSSLFCFAIWIPIIFIQYHDECQFQPEHSMMNLIPGFLLFWTLIMFWQFQGKDDSSRSKRELIIISIVFVLFQVLKSIGGVIEQAIAPRHFQDTANEPQLILHFQFWYNQLLSDIQLCIMICISLIIPSIRLWRHRDHRVSQSQANNLRLVEVLNNNRYKEQFRQFLEKQFSQENLIFYDLCKDVSNKSRNSLPFMDPDVIFEIKDSINGIYDDFISDASRFQVNLPSEIRAEIQKSIKALRSVEVFSIETQVQLIQSCITGLDKAASSIFSLLAADSLPRFLQHRKEKKKHRGSGSLRHTITSFSKRRDTVLSKEGKVLDRRESGQDHHQTPPPPPQC